MDDKWFRQRQKKLGVTAEDIAHAAGRTRSNVSHILNGHQKMSLDWARAFAKVLDVPLAEVLRRAGVSPEPEARTIQPGFAESDAIPFDTARHGQAQAQAIARELGGTRPGVDLWTVKSAALALRGYMPGDLILVDSHQADRCGAGDVVIAQIYHWQTGSADTVLRLYEPPVLIAASADPGQPVTRVVDGDTVVIRGRVIAMWRNLAQAPRQTISV